MIKITPLIACMLLLTNLHLAAQRLNKLIEKGHNKIQSGISTGLSEDEVAAGLKEALGQGVKTGVATLSKTDGYFMDVKVKIPLPEEASEVEKRLRQMGQGEKVDEAIESINRAAEDAANEAKDIFMEAIKNMTLKDAMNILHGNDNAATLYLEENTREALFIRFKPIVKASLDKVGATKHWNTVFTTYNKIPLVKKVNPDLDDFVTNKAIDGLFIKIAEEELNIRNNPGARVSELLKKVFGS